MFTLEFTTVRFFNVSELGSCISSRTQISIEKNRFWGDALRYFYSWCVLLQFWYGKILRDFHQICRIIYIMEFSQEKSLEDILRIL